MEASWLTKWAWGRPSRYFLVFWLSQTSQYVSNTPKDTLPVDISLMVGTAAQSYKEELSRYCLVLWSPALPSHQPDCARNRPQLTQSVAAVSRQDCWNTALQFSCQIFSE